MGPGLVWWWWCGGVVYLTDNNTTLTELFCFVLCCWLGCGNNNNQARPLIRDIPKSETFKTEKKKNKYNTN